ncbi:MAG: response regulator transcription factor [Rhodospirillaceae bacterium]|nr:response regulator transcription factor [Rhodospirillaceae bacterium]
MATNDPIVVHLIDDDDGVREGLTILLAEAGFMVRAHRSGTEFLDALPSATSGVIISDIRMPGLDGLELQQRLKAVNHTLPIIFITGHGDIQMAVQAIKEGASDFIEKPFDDQVLIDAVHTAVRRHVPTPAMKVSGEIVERMESLTPREKEVLECLVIGKLNKITAHELGMSIRTVETHRARIMQKMQARSLSELVRMVMSLQGS